MEAVEAPLVVFEEFLAPQEIALLHAFAASQERAFTQSHVINSDHDGRVDQQHRRSRVLYDLGVFHDIMGRRITHFLKHVLQRLSMAPFPLESIELQMTASNDGEFFRPHFDNKDERVHCRTVTFVYFAHREPPAFSGGELCIYGRDSATGEPLKNVHRTIRPAQNNIAFFPSDWLHEITPVSCPSRAFLDGRITLNGWLRQ
jgi:Rps23 Pro-64 3,4-dihydroxylase Tpa1-like proline 4-hydroxylase